MECRAVSPDTLADFEALIESRGGPHYCWCMAWRPLDSGLDLSGKAARKASMCRRIRSGEPVGILAYEEERPVGWCSVAPRSTHKILGGCDLPDDAKVWSVTCFFVPRSHRGRGMTAELLAYAVAHAKGQGATHVEGYPVLPDSPSYGFMGRIGLFEDAGFQYQHMAGSRRHVMLLEI